MGKKEARFIAVTQMLEQIIEKAESGQFSVKPDFSEELDILFSTSYWGFREITLVIVVARLLDQKYTASDGFYSCKPRALYEQPIRHTLINKQIPHRRSGPLNVAKATVGINREWAGQRRPAHVADAVVRLVEWIETSPKSELENFSVCLMAKFLGEAKKVEALTIEIEPKADPEYLYLVCSRLIQETPDAGNTPQRIFGLLLYTYHKVLNTGIIITGYNDRASTTSTTSKKPGDVNEETKNGIIHKVYEVTVKPFGHQRITESFETLKAFEKKSGLYINEVIVVCRKSDTPEQLTETGLSGVLGKFVYQDVVYYFVEIYEWIWFQLLKMPSESRHLFYELLNKYISHPNTSEDVKNLWRSIHIEG